MLAVHRIINSPISSNCFVLFDKSVSKDCLIVDPGSKSCDELFMFIEKEELTPNSIILTHEHFDHCWGVNEFVNRYPVPVICSSLCAENIKSYKKNCSVFYDYESRFTIDSGTIALEDIDWRLDSLGRSFLFFDTPGHSKASICFTVEDYIFTGDTLIQGESTVTKLPGGSKEDLAKTLSFLAGFKSNGYTACPGHGEYFPLDDRLR